MSAGNFSQIAHVYDHFNDLEIYERWLDFTLTSRDQAPGKVLDAACGTGWFTQQLRSEERRVGKECRSRWSPYH